MQIQCPSCNTVVINWAGGCTNCKFSLKNIHGFDSWHPELANISSGSFFDLSKFKLLASLEDENFWFQARNELIIYCLKKYFSGFQNFAEIGCGTGYVLKEVEINFPSANILGSELFFEGLTYASQRCKKSKLVQLDARRIPYNNQFNVVGIFDVLEHINDDRLVLSSIAKSLASYGGLMITVPQHPWLWSSVDDVACHVRRYTASEIEQKVIEANFEILLSTSFVSLLLPAMFISRFFKSKSTPDAELMVHPFLNWIFRKIMTLELLLIKSDICFSFGGSRIIVAKKKYDSI